MMTEPLSHSIFAVLAIPTVLICGVLTIVGLGGVF